MSRIRHGWAFLAVLVLMMSSPAAVRAEDIVVSNYGIAANGMPFAVALEKGYFRDEGADVTGIISSAGGETTIRNLIGSHAAFAEADLAGTIAAIQSGADLRIVSDDVLTVGDFVWATRPNSAVKTISDLQGRKIGYTNSRSTSRALDILLLQTIGIAPDGATLVQVGSFEAQVAALNHSTIDVATLADPVWSKNSATTRTLIRASEILPPLCNVVGVASAEAIATHGDFIRAVLRGRERAVAFMYSDPDAAARIVARAYDIEPAIAREAIRNLAPSDAAATLPYWGAGRFDLAGMNRMIAAQKSGGALNGDVDLSKIIDRSFLRKDLQTDY